MGQILIKWRVPAAALFSVVLIAGAYFLAGGIKSPRAVEASTESAILKAIAAKDSDGDGLTDWEEALYGTSPRIVDTFNLGMTDGDAVARGLVVPKAIADVKIATSSPLSAGADGLPPPPAEGTLTAAFAKNFFTLYLSVKESKGGADLTESEMQNIASEAISSLSSAIMIAPAFKSPKDLNISGSGADSLISFAQNAEAVLRKNTSRAKKSEILYLQDAVENNDAVATSFIVEIAKGYRDSAAGLAALTVPKELAASDLVLINAMMRISEITSDFARVNDDPLAAILALQQYPQAVIDLGNAFISIGATFRAAGISMPKGESGSAFVNLIQDMADEQTATKRI
jgi:hypothetical protein